MNLEGLRPRPEPDLSTRGPSCGHGLADRERNGPHRAKGREWAVVKSIL